MTQRDALRSLLLQIADKHDDRDRADRLTSSMDQMGLLVCVIMAMWADHWSTHETVECLHNSLGISIKDLRVALAVGQRISKESSQ